MARSKLNPAFLLLPVIFTGLCCAHRSPRFESTDDPRSLRSRTAKAHAEGKTVLDLGIMEGIPPIVDSIEDAARVYSVVVGAPLSQETFIENDRHLRTWYKLHIIERLSTRPASALAPNLAELPPGERPKAGPAGESEVFLLHHGGTLTLNGVAVTERVAGFPPLVLGQKYLFILDVGADSHAAASPLGGIGVFEIENANSLPPLAHIEHPLLSEIRDKYAGSLLAVRRAVTRHHVACN